MKAIEINNLTKFYGKSRGVEDVSIVVNKGEIFGFIGPNGAGKSTTIKAILGLIKKNSGSIFVFGENIEDNLVNILKDVGYLPSEVFYYDKLKAIDLLRYSASFYQGNHEARIKELAEYLELDLNMKIDDMSYGNKKKVGIIQGLLHSPKLIILDEPTGGLDPLIQQKFFKLIQKENEKGATVLFSSHILSEVQRICDRVAIIKEGKIINVEKIENLIKINLKHIKITTDTTVTNETFKLAKITDLEINGQNIKFKYAGNINELIEKLREVNILDLVIEEPDLEDIFMHYYE